MLSLINKVTALTKREFNTVDLKSLGKSFRSLDSLLNKDFKKYTEATQGIILFQSWRNVNEGMYQKDVGARALK